MGNRRQRGPRGLLVALPIAKNMMSGYPLGVHIRRVQPILRLLVLQGRYQA
jgi:hypothetical protein